jgi:hypothetical protein
VETSDSTHEVLVKGSHGLGRSNVYFSEYSRIDAFSIVLGGIFSRRNLLLCN